MQKNSDKDNYTDTIQELTCETKELKDNKEEINDTPQVNIKDTSHNENRIESIMTDKEKAYRNSIVKNLEQAQKSGKVNNIQRFQKELALFDSGKYKKKLNKDNFSL